MTYGYIILVNGTNNNCVLLPLFCYKRHSIYVNRTFLLSRTKEKHIFLYLLSFFEGRVPNRQNFNV